MSRFDGWTGPRQHVVPVGIPASKKNTTTAVLANGESYIGTFEQNDAPDVMVSCITDQPGTLRFDFNNHDTDTGVATTFPSAGFSVAAGIHEFHTAVKGPRWFRVRFDNDGGGGDQTYLRLYTYYGTFRQPNAPLNQTLGNDADAAVVRQYPPQVDLAFGKLGGITERFKFGSRSGLGTTIDAGTASTWAELWNGKRLRRNIPTASFTPYMATTDTGFRNKNVTIEYLDTAGDFATQTANTDSGSGRVGADFAATATEVFRAYINDDTGPSGDLYVTTANNFGVDGIPNDSGQVLAQIARYDNQTELCAFRIRRDCTNAILTGIKMETSTANNAAVAVEFVLQTRAFGAAWRTRRTYLMSNSHPADEDLAIVLDPLSDVRVVIRDVSSAGTRLSGAIKYLIVN